MSVALADNALTTLETVKTMLGIEPRTTLTRSGTTR